MLLTNLGVQPLNDIDEVNMFKSDNTVIHFKRPQIHFSVQENLLVVTGNNDTKDLKELMPEIIKQAGPKQFEYLKNLMSSMNPVKENAAEDDEDVPDLVGTNFEEASKK